MATLKALLLTVTSIFSVGEKQEGLWTRIGDKEYDISEWVNKHPGGRKLASLAVNQDSSDLLISYHLNYEKAEAILQKLPSRAAKIIPAHRTNLQTTFHRELQQEVKEYFIQTGQSPRGGMPVVYRLLFWFVTGLLLNYLTLCQGLVFFAPFLGWWMASMGLAVQHDANHGALFQNPELNSFFGLFDDLIGGSSLIWRHHHDVGHHLWTNDEQEDPDTTAGLPFVRMHPGNEWKWFHKYQHIYFPFVSCLLGFAYPFSDTASFIAKRFGDIQFHPLTTRDYAEFIIGKTLNVVLYFFLPFYLHGFWAGFGIVVLSQMVGGVILSATFAVSHNNQEIDQVAEGKKSKDWAELQIRQSSNWGSHSWFANFLTGGLNQQIEHHLFPSVGSRHYPELAKIVKKKCDERNIPYVSYHKFGENYYSFSMHLKALGVKPSQQKKE